MNAIIYFSEVFQKKIINTNKNPTLGHFILKNL